MTEDQALAVIDELRKKDFEFAMLGSGNSLGFMLRTDAARHLYEAYAAVVNATKKRPEYHYHFCAKNVGGDVCTCATKERIEDDDE